MNLKLNIKVLDQMREDILSLAVYVDRVQDPVKKETMGKELLEKIKAIDLLRTHYKKVLDQVSVLKRE